MKKEGTAPDPAPEGLTSIFAARPVVAIGRAFFSSSRNTHDFSHGTNV